MIKMNKKDLLSEIKFNHTSWVSLIDWCLRGEIPNRPVLMGWYLTASGEDYEDVYLCSNNPCSGDGGETITVDDFYKLNTTTNYLSYTPRSITSVCLRLMNGEK